MTAMIQEAYIQGVSTRSVDDLVKAMGMSGNLLEVYSVADGYRPKKRLVGLVGTGSTPFEL